MNVVKFLSGNASKDRPDRRERTDGRAKRVQLVPWDYPGPWVQREPLGRLGLRRPSLDQPASRGRLG